MDNATNANVIMNNTHIIINNTPTVYKVNIAFSYSSLFIFCITFLCRGTIGQEAEDNIEYMHLFGQLIRPFKILSGRLHYKKS